MARVGVAAGEARDVLTLRVTTASNPMRQGWAINLTIQLANGEQLFIGSISPYPIDSRGSFTVPIPATAREPLTEEGGVLIAELQAASGQAIPEPLAIELSATWAGLP